MKVGNVDFFSLRVSGRELSEEGSVIIHLAVRDRFSANRYLPQRWMLISFSQGLDWYLKWNPNLPAESRRNLARYMLRLTPSMRAWARHMPGAFATYYVHNPDRRRIDNGKRLDFMAQTLFRHSYDGRGIRSRAQAMAWFMAKSLADQGRIRWVSIASGTGQPTFDAAGAFTSPVDHLLIDSDGMALEFSRELAGEYDKTADTLAFECLNVIGDADRTDTVIKDFNSHCIDAMGLVEYLSGDEIIALLSRLYRNLEPGGVLVFTNMRPTHPNLDIHKRAVCWPGVQERSEREIERLVIAAGISAKELTIMLPDDHVYGIYGVLKS